jgi:minor extracellular protease Epr
LGRSRRQWREQPQLRAGHTITWTVAVVLDDGQRRRLPDALVTVTTDEDKGIDVEGTTNRYGKASFVISDKTQRVDAIYVDPLHSGWPMRLAHVRAVPSGVETVVVPAPKAPSHSMRCTPSAASGSTSWSVG